MQPSHHRRSSSSDFPVLLGFSWVKPHTFEEPHAAFASSRLTSALHDCPSLVCRLLLESISIYTSPTLSTQRSAFEWLMKHMHCASQVQLSMH